MKKYVFGLLMFMCFPAFPQSNEAKFECIEDYKEVIDSTGYDMATIRTIFGKGRMTKSRKVDKVKEPNGGHFKVVVYSLKLYYPLLGITFYSSDLVKAGLDEGIAMGLCSLRIARIRFKKPFEKSTRNGIKIGSPVDEVIKKYPKDDIEILPDSSVFVKSTEIIFISSTSTKKKRKVKLIEL